MSGRRFLTGDLDTVATYWRIFRTDGVALAFTTHDRDLWFGGLRHRAGPGMLPSALRLTDDLTDDGADVSGALSHDSITDADLAMGRFDGARVEIGVVDWQSLESTTLYGGTIASITREGAGFSAQLQSAKSAFSRDPVPRSSPGCRARFCGPGCDLPPPAYTHRAAVADGGQANGRISFADLPSPERFLHGELRWIDGPQAGQVMAILAADALGLSLDRMPDHTPPPGTRAILREGCDHTIATCAARFGNAINFRGEPFLPGNDLLMQYPVPR